MPAGIDQGFPIALDLRGPIAADISPFIAKLSTSAEADQGFPVALDLRTLHLQAVCWANK